MWPRKIEAFIPQQSLAKFVGWM